MDGFEYTCLDFMSVRLDTTEDVIATDGVLGLSRSEGITCYEKAFSKRRLAQS